MMDKYRVIATLESKIAWEIDHLGKIPEVSEEHQNGVIAGLQIAKASVMQMEE